MCSVDLDKANDRVPGGGGLCSHSRQEVKHISSSRWPPPRLSLLTILFAILMDRISSCSLEEELVWFGNLRTALLLFTDNAASQARDLWHVPGWSADECEEFKYLRFQFRYDGKTESESDR